MDINFRDYKVNDTDKYSSEFLNQVISDFNNNMTGLYMDYKELIKKYEMFNEAMNVGLDWLTTETSVLASGTYTVSGYTDPVSSTNIELDKINGSFYLEPFNVASKIGRYADTQGDDKAYAGNKVYYYDNDAWVFDANDSKIIDNRSDIWVKEINKDELEISIILSDTEHAANIYEIFPFAGTLVKSVSYKNSAGEFISQTINSKFPFKIHGDFDFNNELRVVLGGVSRNDTYYYSLRYIDIYTCDYTDTGIVTYDIGDYTEITEIVLNDDYITDLLKLQKPVKIQIWSEDESYKYYDSSEDPFPIQTSIPINIIAEPLKIRLTLSKAEEVTPVIKYINVL